MGRPWTDNETSELRELHSIGLSYNQIALELNRSRNAIAGQARRLGLPKRPQPENLQQAHNARPLDKNHDRL